MNNPFYFALLILSGIVSYYQINSDLPPIITGYEAGIVTPDTTLGDTIETTLVIAGVGDIMLGTSYPSKAFLPPDSKVSGLFGSLSDSLASADIAFGNLEGSFLDEGAPVKKCRDTTRCYLFKMPESYSGLLATAGFDIVSLANNHVGDFGEPGKTRTKYLLDSLGIRYAGLAETPYTIFKVNSLTVGFCAFAPNAGTVNIHNTDVTTGIVKFLADSCDIVIVSFHGGAEGADHQRVPRAREVYAGEDRGNVYEFARLMIDSGADVVFGHGPHVARAIDIYKDRFIAYSLGNFCTYSRFNISGPNGLAPVAMITVDESGRFLSGRIIPAYQIRGEGVRYDTRKGVIKKIRDLMALDFPESLISLSEDGVISYR
jgi:hypothetical protein